MRKSFPLLVVSALLALSSAYAANPSLGDQGKMAMHKDGGAIAVPVTPASAQDDKASNVILLDQDSLDALPNPYANPGPRMVSDVWAMRT